MATKNERVTIYPNDDTVEDLDFLVLQDAARTGRRSTRSRVICGLIDEKKREYDTKQNNAARLTDVVIKQDETVAQLAQLAEVIDQQSVMIAELRSEVESMAALLREAKIHE